MLFITLMALSACGGLPALASNTFESDEGGWLINGNGDNTAPILMREGGNPGGHICGKDNKDGDTWYFVAPAKYLGNATAVYGKRLIWDMKQGSTFNQIRGRDVVLNGGGFSLIYNIRAAPGTGWTPYSVSIDDTSGWVNEASVMPATSADIKSALRNLTSLRIRGEFYDGPNDTACLDNVYFGTP